MGSWEVELRVGVEEWEVELRCKFYGCYSIILSLKEAKVFEVFETGKPKLKFLKQSSLKQTLSLILFSIPVTYLDFRVSSIVWISDTNIG
jgi:hypothetical protein